MRNCNLLNNPATLRLKWTICKMGKKLHVHVNKINLLQLISIRTSILFIKFVSDTNRTDTAKTETVFPIICSEKTGKKVERTFWNFYMRLRKKKWLSRTRKFEMFSENDWCWTFWKFQDYEIYRAKRGQRGNVIFVSLIEKNSHQKSIICLHMTRPKEALQVELQKFHLFCRSLHLVFCSRKPRKT